MLSQRRNIISKWVSRANGTSTSTISRTTHHQTPSSSLSKSCTALHTTTTTTARRGRTHNHLFGTNTTFHSRYYHHHHHQQQHQYRISSILSESTRPVQREREEEERRATIDPRKEQESTTWDTFRHHFPSGFAAVDAALAVAETTKITAESTAAVDPVMQYLLQTLIFYSVPSVLVATIAGGVMIVGRSSADKNKTSPAAKKYHHLSVDNAAEDLYNDLYGSKRKKKKETQLEGILRVVRKMSQRGGNNSHKEKNIATRNSGVPPQQFITLTHWNQTLDSYQYSLTAATTSKAQAAAQYRAKNFDRALSTALSTSLAPAVSRDNKDDHRQQQQLNYDRASLLHIEEAFLRKGWKLVRHIQSIQTGLTRDAIDNEMKEMGVKPYEMDPSPKSEKKDENDTPATTNSKDNDNDNDKNNEDTKEAAPVVSESKRKATSDVDKPSLVDLNKHQRKLMELELEFIQDIVQILGTERATSIRVALLGDISARGSGGLLTQLQERPLTAILEALESTKSNTTKSIETEQESPQQHEETVTKMEQEKGDDEGVEKVEERVPPASEQGPSNVREHKDNRNINLNKILYVTRFAGDTRASQVSKFREEVTAIVRNAKPGVDEVVVVLASGGGTVTGYGLAAGQLSRFKEKGIRLTVVVEEVAASGGYMMACIADTIVASPFAAFGSIGVAMELPNVYKRLQREGVEFQSVTAGKHKRNVTPFTEVTEEKLKKAQADLESVLTMFGTHVKHHRPQLDLQAVATGEVWYGTDALERGLCDEIKTADDVLLDYADLGWDVFEVEYKRPASNRRPGNLFFANNHHHNDIGSGERDDENVTEGGFLQQGIRRLIRTFVVELKTVLLAEGGDALSSGSLPQSNSRAHAQYRDADRVRVQ